MSEYVSLEQAAQLEGVSYNAIQKRVSQLRGCEIRYEPGERGGKDRVTVALSALSHKARRVYREQVREQAKMDADDPPWYVYADRDWFIQRSKDEFNSGVRIAHMAQKYLTHAGPKIPYSKVCAQELGMSARTFLEHVQLYTKAETWANYINAETGENYDYIKVLAMCRKPREEADPFPSIPEKMQVWIQNEMYSPLFIQNRQSVTNLYETLVDIAPEEGWEEVPSYHTVWRYVRHVQLMDGSGVKAMAARGLRYWKNKYMMKKYRNTGELRVLEVVQGDVHKFDTWVRVKRSNGKWQAIRPCLVAWMDTRSRALVGWKIAEAPDAHIIKESLITVIYPKQNPELPYGVPRFLLIDNGKEYTAESLTGRPRTVRFELDAETKGFYKSIGIEDDMRSLPYQPWGKAQMERFFGTVCGKFSKRFPAYTGTLSGSKTESKVEKNIRAMLEKEELPTLEAFAEQFEAWVVKHYHKRRHNGLMIQGEDVPAPISTWEMAERYHKAAPPLEYAMSLLAKTYERKVTQMGIQVTIEGRPVYYTHEELMRYINRRVQFRYYPEDITKVVCYDEEGRRICDAVSYELLTIAPKLREAEFIEHNKEQKRQQRGDRNTLIERRMTYEERLAAEETMRQNAGKKVTGPALDTGVQPVVALPEDRQYREEQAEKGRTRKSKRPTTNAYFDRVAEEVIADLERMRKLG